MTRTWKTVLALLALLLAVAALTNPGGDAHRLAARTVLIEVSDRVVDNKIAQMGADTGFAAAGSSIGKMLAGSLINQVVDQRIYRQNFFVFSLTRFKLTPQDDRTIGIGAFNRVWISDEVRHKLETEGLKSFQPLTRRQPARAHSPM